MCHCRELARPSSTVGSVYLLSGELIVPNDAPSDLIRAAGGIVIRFVPGGRCEVACIYREARGDSALHSALLNLGYKPAQAERTAEAVRRALGASAPLEAQLREALKLIQGTP